MKIVFGFSRPKQERVLSKLIRCIEKRDFSHSYVRLSDPSGLDIIFQASGLAVNLCLAENFRKDETIVEEYEITLDDSSKEVVWEYVMDQLGKPYSVNQLIWILIKKVFGIRLSHNDDDSVICSENSARLAIFVGLMVSEDLDYETPSDFQKFCALNMKKVS